MRYEQLSPEEVRALKEIMRENIDSLHLHKDEIKDMAAEIMRERDARKKSD